MKCTVTDVLMTVVLTTDEYEHCSTPQTLPVIHAVDDYRDITHSPTCALREFDESRNRVGGGEHLGAGVFVNWRRCRMSSTARGTGREYPTLALLSGCLNHATYRGKMTQSGLGRSPCRVTACPRLPAFNNIIQSIEDCPCIVGRHVVVLRLCFCKAV